MPGIVNSQPSTAIRRSSAACRGGDYNQLAISEMEAGDYESAMSHYEEALSLADNETALVIRQNIAVLYEKEGDFAKALEQFKECQAAGADTPEVQKEIRFLESR